MEINTEILAREFSATLREWLRPDELAEVVDRNRAETDSYICHSHDFCDPNMAMLGAMETVVGIDVDEVMVEEGNEAIQNAETAPLMTAWNEAWEIAKRNEFREVTEGDFRMMTEDEQDQYLKGDN